MIWGREWPAYFKVVEFVHDDPWHDDGDADHRGLRHEIQQTRQPRQVGKEKVGVDDNGALSTQPRAPLVIDAAAPQWRRHRCLARMPSDEPTRENRS